MCCCDSDFFLSIIKPEVRHFFMIFFLFCVDFLAVFHSQFLPCVCFVSSDSKLCFCVLILDWGIDSWSFINCSWDQFESDFRRFFNNNLYTHPSHADRHQGSQDLVNIFGCLVRDPIWMLIPNFVCSHLLVKSKSNHVKLLCPLSFFADFYFSASPSRCNFGTIQPVLLQH